MGEIASSSSDDSEDDLDTSGDRLLRDIAHVPEALPPAGEPDRTGTMLDRFRIESKLGQGGMGIVYLAEDTRLRRRVALKVLPASIADAERKRRFLREARSASAVIHPCVAAVFDVGETDETVFIAMEYVEGRTLRRVLESGRLPAAEVLRIGAAVARGLGKAHDAGIVHRDLKPDNVMIDCDGHVKILDFGLAKLRAPGEGEAADHESDFATREGRILGTPSYMSPEQAKGRPVDARSDVFSLGIVLYEMIAGARPFSGGTPTEIAIAIDRDAPRPVPRDRRVPRDLEHVMMACLAKQPGDRPANGAAVAALLESARPDARRSGLLAGIAVGVCLLGAAGVAWRVHARAQRARVIEPDPVVAPVPVATPAPAPVAAPAPGAPATASAPAPATAQRAKTNAPRKPATARPATKIPDPLADQK